MIIKPKSYADLSNEQLLELYEFSLFMQDKEDYEYKEYVNDYYVRSQDGLNNLKREILRRMVKKNED